MQNKITKDPDAVLSVLIIALITAFLLAGLSSCRPYYKIPYPIFANTGLLDSIPDTLLILDGNVRDTGYTVVYNNSNVTGAMNHLSPFDELQDMRLGQFDYWKSDKPKTDTIKGWIRYWIQPHWESMELNRTNDSVKFVTHYSDQINEVKFPAIAIYYKDGFTVDSLPESHPIKYHPYNYDINGWLIKIVVNEKEFDLSKKYEFIKAEEVVK